MKKVAAVAVIVFATTVTCLAKPTPSTPPCASVNPACAKAPEIDMSSIGAACALVGCMVFMARSRRQKQ